MNEAEVRKQHIDNYLDGIPECNGYVTLDKIVQIDRHFDDNLLYPPVPLEEIIARAIQLGWKVQLVEGEWALVA